LENVFILDKISKETHWLMERHSAYAHNPSVQMDTCNIASVHFYFYFFIMGELNKRAEDARPAKLKVSLEFFKVEFTIFGQMCKFRSLKN
jgi:hypothetical protein